MEADFRWGSPLGVSVVLFLVYGAIYLLIGGAWPLAHRLGADRAYLIISERTDAAVFGPSPAEILRTNHQLDQLRTILFAMMCGLMVAAGTLIATVAWFGLRRGQPWALAALVLAGVAVLPYWWIVFRPYTQVGAPIGLGDLPPFMWVPAALLGPAALVGWVGLR
ncbi:MAG TPA: hypothetical protein VFX49_17495 [Chloroflexota bacterium]|nr:hypothetical protein [Chloroflexota bacterium]